jgi:transposase
METIASLTGRIKDYNSKIPTYKRWPKSATRRQKSRDTGAGGGVLTAMALVLTLEAPGRFAKSRSVGSYLGLVPTNAQSGR